MHAWNPYSHGDIDLLEKVQRRATKMIKGMRDYSYEDRLMKTGLTTLKLRRDRVDLIQVFKMIKNLDDIPEEIFFKRDYNSRTRGHSLKLSKSYCRTDVRKYFFSNRIVDQWNRLPEHVVSSSTLNQFKNRLDIFLNK